MSQRSKSLTDGREWPVQVYDSDVLGLQWEDVIIQWPKSQRIRIFCISC